jgi:predicted secreted hydrolase
LTGHLRERQTGRRFGYQFTIFRTALTPHPIPRESHWAVTDLYLLHAAVSDFAAGKFHAADRAQRGRPRLAFAAEDSLGVYLLDASAKLDGDVIRIRVQEADFAYDLTCTPTRQPTLQGPGGLNAKGPAKGQASYYYSWTRLKTSGRLTVAGKTFDVEGQSWMDHEFSSNALSATQAGWDWLGLHLHDGSDLMLYRLRDRQGRTDYLSGTRTDASGKATYLSASDFTFEPGEVWKSPKTGAGYPQQWRVSVKGMPSPLLIRSLMKEQEWTTPETTGVDYFEGGVDAFDESGNVVGEGYLEMTGSVKTMAGR